MNRYSSAYLRLVHCCCWRLPVRASQRSAPLPKPTAFGAAIVESSGGKQFAQTGSFIAAAGRRSGER